MKGRITRASAGVPGVAKTCLSAASCALGGARLVGWMTRRAFPGAVRILYCHSPAALRLLSAQDLERRLLHIKRRYGFITMAQALECLRGEQPRHGIPVVLTFDDGYLTFAQTVYPILRRHGIPVTLCVTTGTVGTGGLWTDEVRAAIRALGQADAGLPESGQEASADDAGRMVAAEKLIAVLKRTPDHQRRRVVRELLERTKMHPAGERAMLNWDELRELARDPLVTIASHTITHPILSQMAEDEAQREISDSRRELERNLGIPVSVFSYPNGGRDDFTPACERMAAAAGYDLALSTTGELAQPGCNLYAVPRSCLAWEPWPAFVLRMAGLNDLIARARGRRRSAAPREAADPAPAVTAPSLAGAKREER